MRRVQIWIVQAKILIWMVGWLERKDVWSIWLFMETQNIGLTQVVLFFIAIVEFVSEGELLFRGAGNVMVGEVEFSFPPTTYHVVEGSFMATADVEWLTKQPSAALRIEAGQGMTLQGGYTVSGISVYFNTEFLTRVIAEKVLFRFEIRVADGGNGRG